MVGRTCKGLLYIFVIFVICSIWASAKAEPPALARLKGAEKERVAKLIEGAKKEKELTGYSNILRPELQASQIPAFRKEYGLSEADLQVKIISTRSAAVISKVEEELQAKVYKTDLIQNGTIGWFNDLAGKGELMAYDSPEYKQFHPLATDPKIAPANPPYFIGTFFGPFGICYNYKLIKGEIKSWKDVLRPEYKGKIALADVSKSMSYVDAYLALLNVVGKSFFEELAKQNPFLLVSASDLINKCVAGEFPIVVMTEAGHPGRAIAKGGDLKLVFPPEGFANLGYPMAILARAPHPNAAKLFMDFMHSKVGQEIVFKDFQPVGKLGIKSTSEYPKPIYEMKGVIEMDWRKITAQDRLKAQEEFGKIMARK
jgi:iron(III) transport system substrate-binding protein